MGKEFCTLGCVGDVPQVDQTCVTFMWKALALFYYHQSSLLVQFSAFQRTSGFIEIAFDVGCV